MLTPAETIKALNDIIEHPKKGWLAQNRKERLKASLFLTIGKALIRRVLFMLVKLHLFPATIRAKTFFGVQVYAPIWGALPLVEKGFHGGEDLKLAKFIVDTLKPGDVFVDGGANYGYYSLLANALGAKVYAFEPTNKIFNLLAKNAEGKNIIASHVALWNSTGRMRFYDFGEENNVANTLISDPNKIIRRKGYKETSYLVQTVILDDIPSADFIKLDCEGAEYEILSVAQKTLRHKPILAVELLDISRNSGVEDKIINLLTQNGYKGYYITDGFELEPLEEKGEADMVNAIFLPRE